MASTHLSWRSLTTNVLFAIALLVVVGRSSEARKRSPTGPPPATEIMVGGLVGQSIQLLCKLPTADVANVQWFDEVYNDGVEPKLIYNSLAGSEDEGQDVINTEVDSEHENRDNFRIGNDFSLTISQLNIDLGPGKYFCRSTLDDGTVREVIYQLTVLELPVCSGSTGYHSGQPMHLDCLLAYSGPTRPAVDWYRKPASGHRRHHREARKEKDLINSDDEFDLTDTSPIARKIVRNRAHPIDDGATYRCEVSVGEFKRECHMKLSVEYLAQNLKISPTGSGIFVGDTVRCSAEGNPVPDVELQPQADGSGDGWKSFVVGDEYLGKDLEVSCSATNSLNGTTEQLSGSHTFHVTERPAPTEPTTTPSHHKHGHVSHHSHPPMMDKEESEQVINERAQPVQKQTAGSAYQTVSTLATLIVSALTAYLVTH